MQKEIKKFSLIVKGSIYAYLKEKYTNYEIKEEDKDRNISQIVKHFNKLEIFAYVPDKDIIVREMYSKIVKYMLNKEFREIKLLEDIEENTRELSREDKVDILNGIIYFMELDNKISSDEKSIVLQIAKFLDIENSYRDIIKSYKNSKYKKDKFPFLTLIIGLIIVSLLAGGMYWKYIQMKDTKNYFNKSQLVFSEVYFNKFVIYQNRVDMQSKYFKKSAVYYISGKADIGIDIDGLNYEPITKTLTIINNSSIFSVEISLKNTIEVDKIDPKPISSEEASKMASYVGFAGAIAGAKIGSKATSMISQFLPTNLRFISTAIGATAGGVIGGGAGYYVTNKLLDNLSLSKKITEKEKTEVIRTARNLIKAKLLAEAELQIVYKQKFEHLIKREFLKHNKIVNKIVYKKDGKKRN